MLSLSRLSKCLALWQDRPARYPSSPEIITSETSGPQLSVQTSTSIPSLSWSGYLIHWSTRPFWLQCQSYPTLACIRLSSWGRTQLTWTRCRQWTPTKSDTTTNCGDHSPPSSSPLASDSMHSQQRICWCSGLCSKHLKWNLWLCLPSTWFVVQLETFLVRSATQMDLCLSGRNLLVLRCSLDWSHASS